LVAEILKIDDASIAKAAAIVRRGGLVAYPTDTVYGLGCDPFEPGAIRRLFGAKGREAKPVSVLCSSAAKAGALVDLGSRGLELAREHWPGALTIVAPMKKRLPPQLTQGSAYLGVRVPAHKECLRLISRCGGWLTGTSANISGRPSSRTAAEAQGQIGLAVDLILDGGRASGRESTVVRIKGVEVTILRTGPIGVGNER